MSPRNPSILLFLFRFLTFFSPRSLLFFGGPSLPILLRNLKTSLSLVANVINWKTTNTLSLVNGNNSADRREMKKIQVIPSMGENLKEEKNEMRVSNDEERCVLFLYSLNIKTL